MYKKINRVLVNFGLMAAMPAIAGAAGTYYNGGTYQNRYGSGNGGYYNSYGAGRGYGQNQTRTVRTTNTKITKKSTKAEKQSGNSKQGFYLDAGMSYDFSNWNVEMKNAGSRLHYDNLQWLVFGADGIYYFGNSTPMQVKVGLSYGKQIGESPMIDDDVTKEAMWGYQQINVVDKDGNVVSTDTAVRGTPALSVGTSKGGSQMGFNAAFGFTDAFKLGNMKMTPSIGYRYFKHKLTTEKNYGMMIEVLNSNLYTNCMEVQAGEIQCSPYMAFYSSLGGEASSFIDFGHFAQDTEGNYLIDETESFIIAVPGSAVRVDPGETYYYEQSGETHVYETTWMGPYLALDMEYNVNENNYISAGIELGLPLYNSKGDQPYRWDWAHPTSVEDDGGFGDAIHLGLNSLWSTKVTDSVAISLGFTYDYYHVKDATAKTYYNSVEYQAVLDKYLPYYDVLSQDDQDYLDGIIDLKNAGWTTEDKSEIESTYKSMGIRVGVEVKF